MTQWSFWIGSLAFPITLLTINAIGRWCFDMEQSAAGDLILLFVAFDGTVILQAEDFAPFSRGLQAASGVHAASDLRALYLLFIVITFALWAFAVFGIERRMQVAHATARGFSMSRMMNMTCYIGTAAAAFVLNTAPFTA